MVFIAIIWYFRVSLRYFMCKHELNANSNGLRRDVEYINLQNDFNFT